MANIKNVTELDFDQIKMNLKAYLSAQDKFADYDFDGSGLNILLDVLAYNTQYNALLAHTNANEAFLDSAQLRANVVSHAKSLGYVPSSTTSAQATINVVARGISSTANSITMPRGTVFQGLIGNKQYTFVTNASYTASKDPLNFFYFNNVELYEGVIETFSYRINNRIENQRFKIPTEFADVSTLLVSVRSSVTSAVSEIYTYYNNILDVNSDSNVYYIQESYDGQYEIYFGDSVIGHKPTTGQIVDIAYIKTSGKEANGISSFTINSSLSGLTNIVVSRTTGFIKTQTGSDRESIDSIRFNAPKTFSSQNRAVTATDYRSLLNAEFDFIEDISVWGGEVNVPATYGKVFISIKPFSGEFLSATTKQTINRFLSSKNVGSITTEIVNPDYTFISMDVFFKYDPDNTAQTKAQLEAAVRQSIVDYNDNVLEKFDGVLRYSKLLKAIDNTDKGILNSTATIKMHKHVQVFTNVSTNYIINFSSPIYVTDTNERTLESSSFSYNGQICELSDIPSDVYPNRTVQIRNVSTKAIVNINAGTIEPIAGIVRLIGVKITSIDPLLIYATPNSNDIAPKFNQLVSIEFDDTPGVTVTGEVDLIATLGSVGAASYTTFSRY